MTIRTYSELVKRSTFTARFRYAMLEGSAGVATFGFDRHLNQRLYGSAEWKRVRDIVRVRDNGCDLGVPGMDILDQPYVHHMNPLRPEDFTDQNLEKMLSPENLITVSHRTHNAIHFSDESQLPPPIVERFPGDTTLW